MWEDDINEITDLNRPVMILRKNDLTLEYGCILFNFKSEHKLLYEEKKISEKNFTKIFYVFIEENTDINFFKMLINKFINHFHEITFFHLNFTDEQMANLIDMKRNKCCSLCQRVTLSTLSENSNVYSDILFGNKIHINFAINYIDSSKSKIFSIMKRFKNDSVDSNLYEILREEFSTEQIEHYKKLKGEIASCIFKSIKENEKSVYHSPAIYPSLQSLIRAKFFDNLDFETICAEKFSNINHNEIEIPTCLPNNAKKNCCITNEII